MTNDMTYSEIHAVSYYDEPDGHELVEVDYQCSARCMADTLENVGIMADETLDAAGTRNSGTGSVSWGGWPCGSETDYDVHCSSCGTLLWTGLSVDA